MISRLPAPVDRHFAFPDPLDQAMKLLLQQKRFRRCSDSEDMNNKLVVISYNIKQETNNQYGQHTEKLWSSTLYRKEKEKKKQHLE